MDNNTDLKFSPNCRKKHFKIESRRKTSLRIVGLLTACAFVVYGFSRGEAAVVLNKAVNICLECIGLG